MVDCNNNNRRPINSLLAESVGGRERGVEGMVGPSVSSPVKTVEENIGTSKHAWLRGVF